MAEDYNYIYGRNRDEYDDAAEDYEVGYGDSDDDAGYLDAADYDDHDDYGYEDDTDLLTDEPVGDERLPTGAMAEPVSDIVDDVSSRKGTAPMGSHMNCMATKAGRPMAFLILNLSTSRMAGSLMTWDRKGRAARIPTWKLLAPRARA